MKLVLDSLSILALKSISTQPNKSLPTGSRWVYLHNH